MKRILSLAATCFLCTAALFTTACSSDMDEDVVTSPVKHTYRMTLDGALTAFDERGNRATGTVSTTWEAGDSLYLSFETIEGEQVPGLAVYSAESGWTVSVFGTLTEEASATCKVYYFENATRGTGGLLTLGEKAAVYEALNGTYIFSNDELTVQAALKPKTARLRFTVEAGEASKTIKVAGLSYFSSFNPNTGELTGTERVITIATNDQNTTDYVYANLTDQTARYISVFYGEQAYSRAMPSTSMGVGESGYVKIPTTTSHNGWSSEVYVTADGVKFKMIPVAGYSGGFFLIGETEVTQRLWTAVMGYNNSNHKSETLNLPVETISNAECNAFISQLNTKTGLSFSVPTKEQWVYAAQGGNLSQGYTYAGSNNIDEVAWYSENATETQAVKTKKPNELGIYDMSGNVAERVVIGSYYYYYGGCYNYSAAYAVAGGTYFDYDDSTSSSRRVDAGLRLCLTVN